MHPAAVNGRRPWIPLDPCPARRSSCLYRGLTGQIPPPSMETRELPLVGVLAGLEPPKSESPAFFLSPSSTPPGNLITFFFLNIQFNLTRYTPFLSNQHIDNASSTIRRPRSLAPYRFGAGSQASAGSSCRHHGCSSSRRCSPSSPGHASSGCRSRLPGPRSLWPDGQHCCVSHPRPQFVVRNRVPNCALAHVEHDIHTHHGPLTTSPPDTCS